MAIKESTRNLAGGISRRARLLLELALLEIAHQRKETLLGVIWLFAAPLIQAGGFLIAFNMIRNKGITEDLFVTYFSVMAWSMASSSFIGSLSLFSKNTELLKSLVFPFDLLVITETNVKYFFFLIQFVMLSVVHVSLSESVSFSDTFMALLIYSTGFYFLTLTLTATGTLIGAMLPDLAYILPPVLLILLVLSPAFHHNFTGMPLIIQLVNEFNPLAHLVTNLHSSIGLSGTVTAPYKFMVVAAAAALTMRLLFRRVCQEIVRLV